MVINARGLWQAVWFIAIFLVVSPSQSAEFSANFKGTDIQEFVNTVSKGLNKTIIVDPAVRGTITVRSYDALNEEQYYQFFLSVLDVYGYAVVPMDNGVLKVVRSKDAKTSATQVADAKNPGKGDEVVTRVVQLHNVTARELAPLLRQLIDSTGSGNVAHYEPSNVMLLTGRAAVVNRLLKIIQQVDQAGDQSVETYKLEYASASEMVKLVNTLIKEEGNKGGGATAVKVVADERTNSVLISGEAKARIRVISMLRRLDGKQESQGNTKVIYLKYAKAANLVNILSGVSIGIQDDAQISTPGLLKNVTLKSDDQTNSLIINAAPDVMHELEQVVASLDIRRAQVMVEAIIAEVQDADGLNLGIQWGNKHAGFTQFTNTGLPISTMDKNAWNTQTSDNVPADLKNFNGIAAGFFSGNWRMLITALSNNGKNDILATPSIVTLDNMEATFNVGQEVPVLSGSRTTSGDNIFNTVERKTVGIKLKVTPQINAGDSVLLEIEQEVSSVADSTGSSSANLGAVFNTRTVNNAILVGSGETVVVGGLLDRSNKESVNKVPILGDIPLLGYLFRSSSKETSKRNLMLFIRPTIIRDQQSYTDASNQKYNEFRKSQMERDATAGWWEYPKTRPLVMDEYQSSVWSYNKVKDSIADFYASSGVEGL